MAIRNLLFDFGQVLIHFEPEEIVSRYGKGISHEDSALLVKVLFDRTYWDKLDAGTISAEEVVALTDSLIPERLHPLAKEILEKWIYDLPAMEGMEELIRTMKEKYVVRVFLLSNISREFAEQGAKTYPVLREMEGCVFSSLSGYTKPNPEIFRYTCAKFSILPQETVFIDDNEKNIASAEKCGLHTFRFMGDAAELKCYLDGLLQG